jgi:hypothetical protein
VQKSALLGGTTSTVTRAEIIWAKLMCLMNFAAMNNYGLLIDKFEEEFAQAEVDACQT